MRKWLKTAMLISSSFLLLLGCQSGSGGEHVSTGNDQTDAIEDVKKKPEPITLKLFNNANTTQYNFETKFKAHVDKKYPHITLEFVLNQKGTTMSELAAINQLPDLVYGKISDRNQYMMDLTPLMEKHRFDKSKIKPVLWETYSFLTDTDKKTLFVPFMTNMHLLHYNKSLFEKFGVPYPKNGMTWDETYELAKKLTRTEGSVKYMGFNLRDNLHFTQGPQMLLPYYDETTGKATLNSDNWQRYLANFIRFFQIPGNEATKSGGELGKDSLFLKEQRVAMYAAHPLFSTLADMQAEGTTLDWDIVSLPYFPEAPRQGTSPNTNGLGITVTTKYPEEAWKVIELLVSHEVQLLNARQGYESVLADDAQHQKEFGSEYEVLKGKNISAIFYNHYAPTPKPNDFNSSIKGIVTDYFRKAAWGETDLNTALREANEAANKKIEEVRQTLK